MILLRGVLTAILTAGILLFAAERAAADHIGHSLPAMEPAGLIFASTSVDEMTPEMRKAYIRGIQEELAAHRYDPGPTDGLLGPMTHRAIRKYKRDAGLPVDDVASKELLDHLKFAKSRRLSVIRRHGLGHVDVEFLEAVALEDPGEAGIGDENGPVPQVPAGLGDAD